MVSFLAILISRFHVHFKPTISSSHPIKWSNYSSEKIFRQIFKTIWPNGSSSICLWILEGKLLLRSRWAIILRLKIIIKLFNWKNNILITSTTHHRNHSTVMYKFLGAPDVVARLPPLKCLAAWSKDAVRSCMLWSIFFICPTQQFIKTPEWRKSNPNSRRNNTIQSSIDMLFIIGYA